RRAKRRRGPAARTASCYGDGGAPELLALRTPAHARCPRRRGVRGSAMTDLDVVLRRIRRQWVTLTAFEVSARALIACGLIVAAFGLVDRWAHPGDTGLLAIAVAALFMAVAVIAALAAPLRRVPDDRRIARFVEERVPGLDDAIVTAVDVRDRASGESFGPLVLASAVARLKESDLSQIVAARDRRNAAWRSGAAVAACVLAVVLAWPAIDRALQVAYLRLLPGSVTLDVKPGDARVPAGQAITIRAGVAGLRASLDRIVPSVTVTIRGQSRTLSMQR